MEISELMEIYSNYSKWEWRFGETPQFSYTVEHKFSWALVEVQLNSDKGFIQSGKVYSDCLVPVFIDVLNTELATGTVKYDVEGIAELCNRVRQHFTDDSFAVVREQYIPEFQEWLSK